MAKIVINTLNITLGAGRNPLVELLRGLHGQVSIERASEDSEPQTSATAEPTQPEAAVPVLSTENVIAFLRSDPRYTLRTFEAIAKQFPGVSREDVRFKLGELAAEGELRVKHRISDGATLYEAVWVATPAAEPEFNGGPLSYEVTDFLQSDDRYRSRTMGAIVKHFAGSFSEQAVQEKVNEMVDNDELDMAPRRRDGEAVYWVA